MKYFLEEVNMSQDSEFDRLEQYVGKLLTQYDQLRNKHSQLQKLLDRREEEILRLQEKVDLADSERGDISSRIKHLIDQIEDWQAGADVPVGQVVDDEEQGIQATDDEEQQVQAMGAEEQPAEQDQPREEREAGMQRNLFNTAPRSESVSGD